MATSKSKNLPAVVTVDASADGPDSVIDFRKANDSIGLRVVEGHFSLLSRKLYNVFISTAQKLQRPGLNAPTDEPAAESYFWIPLQTVVKDTKYNSNDYETLKEHANELQNIRVEAESTKMWTSERLLSGLKIYNSKGLKSKGGIVWLGFAFPPEVLQMVLQPTVYTKFSLWYQTQLRTASSLALYEVCRRYATSPSHLTNRAGWTHWYYTITGTVTSDTNLPEYKYFKRDHLAKSITEVNAITDIEVELLEFKEGRKVSEIQFRVYPKAQTSFELPAVPIINSELLDKMIALGLSKDDATATYLSYDEHVIRAHLKLVESRSKNSKLDPLWSSAAYFKNAIKGGFANGKAAEVVEVKKPVPQKKNNVRERFLVARAKDALAHYEKLITDEQKKLLTAFTRKADKTAKPLIRKGGLSTSYVRKAFSEWLAVELWGEPTDSQIVDFIEMEAGE